jgi:hypothetical protein
MPFCSGICHSHHTVYRRLLSYQSAFTFPFLSALSVFAPQAESMLLGQSRGKEVRVMVHHSRNSEQKQWDETVVIALGGMARLLRAHLPAIVGMDRVAGKQASEPARQHQAA